MVFVGPNGLPSSVSHLFIGDVVYVGDAEELSEPSTFLVIVGTEHRAV